MLEHMLSTLQAAYAASVVVVALGGCLLVRRALPVLASPPRREREADFLFAHALHHERGNVANAMRWLS